MIRKALSVLVLILGLGGTANADDSGRPRQNRPPVSMEPYTREAVAARIYGAAVELRLAFARELKRFEAMTGKLEALEKDPKTAPLVGISGKYFRRFSLLQAGMPSAYEPAHTISESLDSIIDRHEAGERFELTSAERFIFGQCQPQLFTLRLHLAAKEKAVDRLVGEVQASGYAKDRSLEAKRKFEALKQKK
jgi:hypothetical protein